MSVDFFFFLQKTAVEIRFSDWSSYLCSSDLSSFEVRGSRFEVRGSRFEVRGSRFEVRGSRFEVNPLPIEIQEHYSPALMNHAATKSSVPPEPPSRASLRTCWRRSEEHTSELQSLMRISYAVFCLKKKRTTQKNNTAINITISQTT